MSNNIKGKLRDLVFTGTSSTRGLEPIEFTASPCVDEFGFFYIDIPASLMDAIGGHQ